MDNSSGRQWTMADGGRKRQRKEATNGAEGGDLMAEGSGGVDGVDGWFCFCFCFCFLPADT